LLTLPDIAQLQTTQQFEEVQKGIDQTTASQIEARPNEITQAYTPQPTYVLQQAPTPKLGAPSAEAFRIWCIVMCALGGVAGFGIMFAPDLIYTLAPPLLFFLCLFMCFKIGLCIAALVLAVKVSLDYATALQKVNYTGFAVQGVCTILAIGLGWYSWVYLVIGAVDTVLYNVTFTSIHYFTTTNFSISTMRMFYMPQGRTIQNFNNHQAMQLMSVNGANILA
jgi:hypothetical protein